jgi:hypothetical protein
LGTSTKVSEAPLEGGAPNSRFPGAATPLNGCRACGQDFSSLETFDGHRVGSYKYTFARGLQQVPPVEDGRRCLDRDEMLERGWEQSDKGRWFNPARAERARKAFEEDA